MKTIPEQGLTAGLLDGVALRNVFNHLHKACVRDCLQALSSLDYQHNAAYPKAAGMLPDRVELRQVKYLNNLIEQDHRLIKRLTKPGMGLLFLRDSK